MPIIDLINPKEALAENYKRQIQRTIESYSIGHIVVSEAIQNALDAIARQRPSVPKLEITIDFDESSVIVKDNGNGFPNDATLLLLGGSDKTRSSRTISGMVGVGIKVVLYCTKEFEIRTKTSEEAWKVIVSDSYRFADDDCSYEIHTPFENDPDSPINQTGTLVRYRFPYADDMDKWALRLFMDHVKDMLVDKRLGESKGFSGTVRNSSVASIPAYLVYAYLSRFTYLGDTLGPLGGRDGLNGLEVKMILKCSNPMEKLGQYWADVWGDDPEQTMDFQPGYLKVADTIKLKAVRRPAVFGESLGAGGLNLDRTKSGFNVTEYIDKDQYLSLLKNSRGNLPRNHERFEKLFEKTNCITVTIGRIPQFEEFLPGGSRRVLSANGVVTGHDIDITSGRNQQYVRCLDIVVDLDGQLNYGKVHFTDGRLVGLAKDYINEAYRHTLQTAASRYVGFIVARTDDEPTDKFWERPDLDILLEVPLVKVPADENDVIALFCALLGSGDLEGYKAYGFSQRDTYDSKMIAVRDSDRDDLLDDPKESDLRTVEFKIHASQILRDFDSQVKQPNDINLLITWGIGNWENETRYEIYDIEHSEYFGASPKKTFPGVTHVVHDRVTDREVQTLVLETYLGHDASTSGSNAPIIREQSDTLEQMRSAFEPIRAELEQIGVDWRYMQHKVGITTPFGRANITVRKEEPLLYVCLRLSVDFDELQTNSSIDWQQSSANVKTALARISPKQLIEFLSVSI